MRKLNKNFKDDLIIELCKNKSVLHIGAADYPFSSEKAKAGVLLHQKLQKVSKNIIGTDLSNEAIMELKKYNISDIIKKDISIPFTNSYKNKFDIIILGDVIEHLFNPGLALENLKNIMGKETKLIITTPNCYCYDNIANIFRNNEIVHQDHCFWPSKKTMIQLFSFYNFKVVNFNYLNFGSYDDIRTLKGKLFSRIVLNRIKKIRSTLFFILKLKE